MAMAFATLASAHGTLTIDDKAVVNKTYPAFWDDYERLQS
jgi:5-enolpyruvylshikimate-3-phosphate synthase